VIVDVIQVIWRLKSLLGNYLTPLSKLVATPPPTEARALASKGFSGQ
jgi:hypothetical protein